MNMFPFKEKNPLRFSGPYLEMHKGACCLRKACRLSFEGAHQNPSPPESVSCVHVLTFSLVSRTPGCGLINQTQVVQWLRSEQINNSHIDWNGLLCPRILFHQADLQKDEVKSTDFGIQYEQPEFKSWLSVTGIEWYRMDKLLNLSESQFSQQER